MAYYLVYNGFWNPNGLPESAAALSAAAAAEGMRLIAEPNTAWIARYGTNGTTVAGCDRTLADGDTVIFWDKDTRLAHAMEAVGARLFNTAAAVELCDDKLKTHAVLAAAGLPMPHTLAAPMTYLQNDEQGCAVFWQEAARVLGFPMVVKECFGSLGGQVYLAHNREELKTLTLDMGAKPFLAQQFIASSAGNDKRLYVVGDHVVAAMRRHSDTDFRANIENGGVGSAYTPTAEECGLALAACRALGLHFGGVDILDSEDGPLLCEVNSNAHMAGITAATGVDVARAVMRYVKETTA